MAENYLVVEPLTDNMIKAGSDLIAQLPETSLDIAAAFWIYTLDVADWRLSLASPSIESEGKKRAYEIIWAVTFGNKDQNSDLSLGLQKAYQSVTVVSTQDMIVRALAGLRGLTFNEHTYVRNIRLNGVFVEGLYVYFIGESIEPLPDPWRLSA